MKHIEIGIPAILPLAIARLSNSETTKPVMLGVTLQHPPIHFLVARHKEMKIYGPRADVVRQFAEMYAARKGLEQAVEIRIDSTSPSMVGVGSDSLLALGAAQAMAWVNGLDFEDVDTLAEDMEIKHSDPLAYWGYKKGGFLLVELDSTRKDGATLLRHHSVHHRDHLAWAFVYHFPKIPQGTAESIEADRLDLLKTAVFHMPPETGGIIDDQLWPALLNDDLVAFGQALMALMGLNETVLKALDSWLEPTESAQKVLDLFAEDTAVAWGVGLTGFNTFGLLKGGAASQEIRAKMLQKVGYFSGQFDATISDVDGAKFNIKDEDLHKHDYQLPNLQPGISGPRRKK